MASKEATVKDIADFFNKLVAAGKGEYHVEASTQDGASYGLFVSEEHKDDEQCNDIAYVYDNLKLVSIGE